MAVGGQPHALAALHPGKEPGTHCTGVWMGPRAGLYLCGSITFLGIKRDSLPNRH